jgi:tRNA nucleotidyltransferase (CCA-adding enzyme)
MDNVGDILGRQLQPRQLAVLHNASEASASLGIELYLVGGTVRDLLFDRSPMDLDLSVEGGTPETPDRLAQVLGAEVVSRSEFGTAKLRARDVDLDLVAARREFYAGPGALPTVSPGDILDDLARRDFSVNAMAVSLGPDEWGRLLDPHGGREDLAARVLRVHHDASFVDDATRILRAVRYMARLGLELEPNTALLLRRDVHHLDGISGDRVRRELVRILDDETALRALVLARELGVLAAVHHALDAAPELLDRLSATTEGHTIGHLALFAALTYGAEASLLPGLVRRLNMDSAWARVVRDMTAARSAIPALAVPDIRASRIHSALRSLHPTAIQGCAMATNDDAARGAMEKYLAQLRQVAPTLNGSDVMALGVPEGPLVGEALQALLSARLDGEITTREDEERLVRDRLGQ